MSLIRLSALAQMIGGVLVGADREVTGVASLKSADLQRLVFLSDLRKKQELIASKSKAVIVKTNEGLPVDVSYIVCSNPALAFARASAYFNPLPISNNRVHPSAVIAEDVVLPVGVEVGPHVVVEPGVKLGEFVQLKAGVFIGSNSKIGSNTIIYPRAVIYADSEIGEHCVIHSGAVIGADGFGNAWAGDHWERIPQIGRVIIGDNVEIGANTTIDRGALDDTVIESGVRLDNQIQVAHNVKIGRNTAIAACTAIAGSAEIGRNCMIGGGALIAGHLKIADGVTLLGGSGVPSSIHEPGVYASGVPVVPHADWLKNMVHLRKLDGIAKRLKQLEKQVAKQGQEEQSDSN
ncbi:UDP-3-O-(3-hydroxymyristoyl)glucosamine N-acyltransferase [Chitinibacter sp. ZOR0017]|uniref:UDP-3-O-(3-hydroxymyristoyl)glucosamine N-acyltransferase n=1 Tax=Chitinibacter sp. ZOR0017 TaxID=1339254 RepID=UPI0006456A6E|nr:UDP-3-O-(3-hydroxymyristoyl)glucosamine N-acyltransferase [Chitinibacter sp. ZOR0017]